MKFTLTDNSITIGEGNLYALSELSHWKLWLADDGKRMLKVEPKAGKAEIYEVEFEATFYAPDGTPVPSPDYFILSWRKGMSKPECAIKSGDKFMAATWEPHAVEPPKPRRKRPSFISVLSDGHGRDEDEA